MAGDTGEILGKTRLGWPGPVPYHPAGPCRPGLTPVPLSASIAWRMTLVALVSVSGGCASLGKPEWLEPGPARNQQRRAVRFDPFLEDDIGPYAFRQYGIMDGTRPRDYAEPVPEVRRARWWSSPSRR